MWASGMTRSPVYRFLFGVLLVSAKYIFLFWALVCLIFLVRTVMRTVNPEPIGWDLLPMLLVTLVFFHFSDVADLRARPLFKTNTARVVSEFIAFVLVGSVLLFCFNIGFNLSFFEPTLTKSLFADVLLLVGALAVLLVARFRPVGGRTAAGQHESSDDPPA